MNLETAAKKKPAAARPALVQANPKADLIKGTAVIEEMLKAGQSLRKRPVLMGYLQRFGLAMNNWDGMAHCQEWFNASVFGLQQIPTEYVDYLLYAADKQPESCLEIGVYTGGSSVFSCAFFQALNPNFRYVGVDIADKLILNDKLRSMLNLEYRIPCSSNDLTEKDRFDIVFIDGDHSYQWAKRDYLNAGRYARKLCAFHDIHAKEFLAKGGGVYKFWRQLRASLAMTTTMVEFAHAQHNAGVQSDSCWMGIGVLDFTRNG